ADRRVHGTRRLPVCARADHLPYIGPGRYRDALTALPRCCAVRAGGAGHVQTCDCRHSLRGCDVITPEGRETTRRVMAERLQASEPFAFSRWGDGEWSAVLGIGTANCDGQAYAPLRDDLR